MKKIEKKMALMVKDNLLSCPKCREPLELENKSLKCINKHTYDLSKKGTVNFVLGYGEDNYNLAMLEARERVIEKGFFNPVLDGILKELYEDLVDREKTDQTITILDAGCGDGSHLEIIGAYLNSKGIKTSLYGVDLSKDGIHIAGRKENEAVYFVADLSDLPFIENSFDVIINILSPANYQDFKRVLKNDGRVYKVIPDAGYLKELRTLYGLSEYSNDDMVAHLKANAQVLESIDIYEEMNVEDYVDDLLLMTPMLWNKEMVGTAEDLSRVTVDAKLFVFLF